MVYVYVNGQMAVLLFSWQNDPISGQDAVCSHGKQMASNIPLWVKQ